MSRIFALLLSTLGLMGLLPRESLAAGFPEIVSATVDYTQKTLTINGQNFGSRPAVRLDSTNFPTMSSASNQIVANFPNSTPPSSFTPGTYFLTVEFKNQLPAVFAVDIGANGPAGAPGPAGAQGPQGVSGAPGPAGPAGPPGLPGSMGPSGASGAAGPVGAAGLQGAPGAQGPQGAPGPQGQAGVNGTNGAGVPVCAAPSTFLVLSQGTFVCQARLNGNGDGTLTDNQTGLMWELKSVAGTGDVHDVNNSYTWSSTGSAADGTLYTTFLSTLNADASTDGGSTCFANHCDWRVPNISELRSIVETSASNCGSGGVCIDPAFGPTQVAAGYWSSTTGPYYSYVAWTTGFGFALSSGYEKPYPLPARAVRSAR
jgi:Protein of unknown function (DUF1566)/Collagen triple helix repeat (20 copies)